MYLEELYQLLQLFYFIGCLGTVVIYNFLDFRLLNVVFPDVGDITISWQQRWWSLSTVVEVTVSDM